MTFGYNATAAFGNSVAGIRDHARGLLGELVEKRERSFVSWVWILLELPFLECIEAWVILKTSFSLLLTISEGSQTSPYFCRAFVRRAGD
jgi:hypothetical protein